MSFGVLFKGRLCPSLPEGQGKNCPFYHQRLTAINNWRLQGSNYFRIMAVIGQKTLKVCKGYNLVSKEGLKSLGRGNLTYGHSMETRAFHPLIIITLRL